MDERKTELQVLNSEGQGRLDGAFCDFTINEKLSYLHHLNQNGVRNIEMEATAFAALTHQAGVRYADSFFFFFLANFAADLHSLEHQRFDSVHTQMCDLPGLQSCASRY